MTTTASQSPSGATFAERVSSRWGSVISGDSPENSGPFVTCGMQAFLQAFDEQQAHLEIFPDTPDEAGWLEAVEQGLVRAFDDQLRPLVNAALAAAGHGAYRMQVYKGRNGPCHVFTVGLAPRPTNHQG